MFHYHDENLFEVCATVYYAGIGSRKTPADIMQTMQKLAAELTGKGYVLRSGGADGADTAFEHGARKAGGRADIWLPWQGFNDRRSRLLPLERHMEIASIIHPVWNKLKPSYKKLHSRNVGQILGSDFKWEEVRISISHRLDVGVKDKSAFVLCWTPDGAESHLEVTSRTGGTGTAISLAGKCGVPVVNMQRKGWRAKLDAILH